MERRKLATNSERGFTIMEVIVVIIILGVLAVVAIPRYVDFQEEAEEEVERSIIAAVRTGVMIEHNKSIVSP